MRGGRSGSTLGIPGRNKTLRWAPGLAEMAMGTCSFSLRMWRTVPKRQKHRSSKIVFAKNSLFGDPVPPTARGTGSHLKDPPLPTLAYQKKYMI